MARHFIFLDPLEKLVLKKDSSCLLAHTFKELGHEVYLLFEKDFHYQNSEAPHFHVYDFQSTLGPDSFYLQKFVLGGEKITQLKPTDVVHMRLDPPFDSRYLRYCWMLQALQTFGIKVVNDPRGIITHNEKLYAYTKEGSVDSFVGSGTLDFLSFAEKQKDQGIEDLILKPLDLYQGIGVEKVSLKDKNLKEIFVKKVKEYQGPVVAQTFIKSVEQGEVRALFYRGVELGSILKVPPAGNFLANIAQGASYHLVDLNPIQRKRAEEVCQELMLSGVDWVAFDILGDSLSEVNITCPGLLVEVSKACQKNLARPICESFAD